LPAFQAPWLAREDFEARLSKALEAFPEFKENRSALPGCLPAGYEKRRTAWLKSIPSPPDLDSFER
jgi:hypothetical protein